MNIKYSHNRRLQALITGVTNTTMELASVLNTTVKTLQMSTTFLKKQQHKKLRTEQ